VNFRLGIPAARRVACACLVAAALALTGGCATVMRGVTQDVQVATDPAGAACELKDRDGKVVDAVPLTPGYVRVRKGLASYVVACRHDGYLDATSQLDSGIESDEAAGMTWGALSGLQGAAGSTVTSAALGTMMPAATAATYASWLGIAGLVSFAIDLATGAMFEYPAGVALTLVPATFPSPVARDRFFDQQVTRLREQHAIRRRELVSDCKVACQGAIASLDRGIAREVAELERLRASAKVAP
jgi:hypothetical protein